MELKLLKEKLIGSFKPASVVMLCLTGMIMLLIYQSIGFSRKGQMTYLSSLASIKPDVQDNQAPPPELPELPEPFASLPKLANDEMATPFSRPAIETRYDPAIDLPKNPAKPKKSEWKTVRMRVTGYCPCKKCCGRSAKGITASGHKISWGNRFVAAPKNIPFGSEIIIPGYNNEKPVKVLDRGRVIKGNRLDVFYNTHHTAGNWGTKYLNVKIKYSK
jgi:3D (Asp-Asp-Asp) domain-containing protein